MSRPLRIQYKNAWYHVMNRGRRKETTFRDNIDFEIFTKLLQDSSLQWGVNIASYCLMPNHYHLLIQTPLANLSRFMRHIDGVYTQRFNRKHKLDGQLFRGRYKSILVEESNYLLELVRYIHFNPVKSDFVDAPEKYSWSSFQHYQSNSKNNKWIVKNFVFQLLGLKENYKSKKYLTFLNQDATDKIYEFFEKKNIRSIMGSKIFQNWVKVKLSTGKINSEIPESKLFTPTLDDILASVCMKYQIKQEQILKVRRGASNIHRDLAIYLCRLLTEKKLLEIGTYFKTQKYSTISNAIIRAKYLMSENKKVKTEINELINTLNKSQRKI
jgi:putative transposase